MKLRWLPDALCDLDMPQTPDTCVVLCRSGWVLDPLPIPISGHPKEHLAIGRDVSSISPNRGTGRIVAFVDASMNSDADTNSNAHDCTSHSEEDQKLDEQSLPGRQLTQPLAASRLCHARLLSLPELESARCCILSLLLLLCGCRQKVDRAGFHVLEIDLGGLFDVKGRPRRIVVVEVEGGGDFGIAARIKLGLGPFDRGGRLLLLEFGGFVCCVHGCSVSIQDLPMQKGRVAGCRYASSRTNAAWRPQQGVAQGPTQELNVHDQREQDRDNASGSRGRNSDGSGSTGSIESSVNGDCTCM